MEKVAGVGLESRWLEMGKRERHRLASNFVEIEKKILQLSISINWKYLLQG